MFIKLVNPVNRSTLTFQIGNEIHTELTHDMDFDAIQAYEETFGKPATVEGTVLPVDIRRFSVWDRTNPERTYSYVTIEVPKICWNEDEQLVIFTNWHAYLMSDSGQTIDRLFTNTEVGP